jgi:hypothetical protein
MDDRSVHQADLRNDDRANDRPDRHVDLRMDDRSDDRVDHRVDPVPPLRYPRSGRFTSSVDSRDGTNTAGRCHAGQQTEDRR